MAKRNLLFSIKEIYYMARSKDHPDDFINELLERIDGTLITVDKTERVKNSYFQVIEIKMDEV